MSRSAVVPPLSGLSVDASETSVVSGGIAVNQLGRVQNIRPYLKTLVAIPAAKETWVHRGLPSGIAAVMGMGLDNTMWFANTDGSISIFNKDGIPAGTNLYAPTLTRMIN